MAAMFATPLLDNVNMFCMVFFPFGARRLHIMAAYFVSLFFGALLLKPLFLVRAQSSNSTATSQVSLAAPTSGTDCSQLIAGTNVSICYFTLVNIPPCAVCTFALNAL